MIMIVSNAKIMQLLGFGMKLVQVRFNFASGHNRIV
jgi:hypothetical protein